MFLIVQYKARYSIGNQLKYVWNQLSLMRPSDRSENSPDALTRTLSGPGAAE